VRFLLDENVALALAAALREAGHEARHILEIGRARTPDEIVRALAIESDEVIITGDLDFCDERDIAPSDPSVFILRVWPNLTPELLGADVVKRIAELEPSAFRGNIVVLEPGSTRIRTKEA
jgi:predicted nuclease of predicted toxin-antitoxin system